MPTVGCEADAVAYNEEEQVTKIDPEAGELGPLFSVDGSYSIPADFNSNSRQLPDAGCT